MKCEDINEYIDGFIDKRLIPDDLLSFERHVLACAECAEKLESAEALLSGLRNLPVEKPSAGFRQRVFAEVRRQHSDNHQKMHGFRFAAGFATAAVASLAIWFVSSVYVPDVQVEQPQMISVSMSESRTVSLLFDSQTDIQLVSLSIDLPANFELDGYPGRRELSWNTSLKKGQNILALPIMATGYGQGKLLAKLSYGEKIQEFSVVLRTDVDGA